MLRSPEAFGAASDGSDREASWYDEAERDLRISELAGKEYGLASGRSLPVHCVVEAVAALGGDGKLGWKRRPVVETDSYVIIPANTAFHDLVAVALARLGYPTDSASAAKGTVVIKNWKPLNFDKITDGSQATVEDILGELTTVATLRIELYRARPSVLADIKDKLLRLLLLQSHGLLLSAGCPLDEVTLSHLCRGAAGAPGLHPPPLEPTEDMRRKFEQWWSMQMAQQAAPGRGGPPGQPQFSPGGPHAVAPPVVAGGKALDRPPSLPDAVHPALQTVQSQYPTQKTRMRTSFDPELELPKLQRWFAENQHPSRQQIQQYVKELNGLESRRGRKPLDVNNVVYWFKNARAAQKRAELRGVGPGLSCSLSLNGYNSSSHSPPGALLGSESLPHHEKSPGSPPLHSPSGPRSGGGGGIGGGGGSTGGGGSGAGTPAGAGGSFMTDAHSDNSPAGSDQEDDEEEGRGGGGEGLQPPPPPPPPPPLPPGARPEHPEGRGDPRAELRGHEDMDDGRGSPAAPLALTTNDKDPLPAAGAAAASPLLQGSPQLPSDFSPRRSPLEGRRSAFSPPSSAFDGRRSAFAPRSPWAVPLQADIKQEPPEDAPSPAPSNNNNNNGSVKETEEGSDGDDDDDEEELEEAEERRLGLKEEPAEAGAVALRAPDRSSALRPFRTPSPDVLARGPPGAPGLAPAGFPLVPNSMFSHSIMYMSHYIPGLAGHALPPGAAPASSSGGPHAGLNLSALSASAADERRKRNRTFIDPVTEVPRLEQWFALNTHPSHNLILKYTEELNRMPYRQKFPRLEPKNVQFWFKNRRAKCKRLKMSLFENGPGAAAAAVAAGVNHQHHHSNPYHHSPPGSRD